MRQIPEDPVIRNAAYVAHLVIRDTLARVMRCQSYRDLRKVRSDLNYMKDLLVHLRSLDIGIAEDTWYLLCKIDWKVQSLRRAEERRLLARRVEENAEVLDALLDYLSRVNATPATA